MTAARPTLWLLSGLPGSGKSSLARRLAAHRRAVYLRIDTVEQGLRDLCGVDVQGEGYRLSYRIAADNLALGLDVVADSCNPVELTRREWAQVAASAEAAAVDIEVVCSDATEHRRRVETRESQIPGLRLPTWAQVQAREYAPWTTERIIVDTAGRDQEASFAALLTALEGQRA